MPHTAQFHRCGDTQLHVLAVHCHALLGILVTVQARNHVGQPGYCLPQTISKAI